MNTLYIIMSIGWESRIKCIERDTDWDHIRRESSFETFVCVGSSAVSSATVITCQSFDRVFVGDCCNKQSVEHIFATNSLLEHTLIWLVKWYYLAWVILMSLKVVSCMNIDKKVKVKRNRAKLRLWVIVHGASIHVTHGACLSTYIPNGLALFKSLNRVS